MACHEELENKSSDEVHDSLQSQTDADLKLKELIVQALASDLHGFEDLIQSSTAKILNAFEQKLAYDATKQKQIDDLHSELQRHRTDLIARTNRPLVNGLISLYDGIDQLILKLNKHEELDPELFFNAFESIKEDIEILLDQNGVISFSETGERFDPKRQNAVRHVKTSEDQLIGTIAKRIRLGFEQGNDLIQKERVSVYVLDDVIEP